jgi:DNA-binding GntR family transcriptional regulator
LCGSTGGAASLAAELEERRREFVLSRLERQAGDFSPTSPEFGLPLPEQIAEVLADEIIEREVAPGSRLPEPALAERFGTSRAPVVKAYSRREIEELYQVRITLERLALERICEDPDMVDACLATLEPIMREMEAAQDDPMRYRELNYLFHRSIIVVSRSDLIRRLYAQIEGPLKIFLRRMFFPKGAARKSFGEHLQILAAIEEADVKKAQQRLEKHDLDGMKRAIASSLPDQPAAGRQ